MAQKRMFDKAIIDTDRFMDLSMSSKALYFLLGMDADDEGFVSYKKVMRVHGGNEDDIKVLMAKNFIISFKSGVVVITDWNKNNYLDKNRLRETEYQTEKKMLILTHDGTYELNNRLTSIEESSIEENRIEQNSTVESSGALTPAEIARDFFIKGDEHKKMLDIFSKNASIDFVEKEFDKFILYWTEPNKSGTKVRWEREPTFEIRRRLTTWFSRLNQYQQNKQKITNIL